MAGRGVAVFRAWHGSVRLGTPWLGSAWLGMFSPPMNESRVQAEILLALGSRKDLKIWRQQVGSFQRGKRWIRVGVEGQSDIGGIFACGKCLQLEVKDRGGRVRDAQRRWGSMIESMGGVFAVVRSVEEAEEVVKKHRAGCSECKHRPA